MCLAIILLLGIWIVSNFLPALINNGQIKVSLSSLSSLFWGLFSLYVLQTVLCRILKISFQGRSRREDFFSVNLCN